MLTVVRIALFFGLFIGLPMMVGKILASYRNANEKRLSEYLVLGMVIMLFIGYVECMVAIYIKMKLSTFTYLICGEALLVAILCVLIKGKVIMELPKELFSCLRKPHWGLWGISILIVILAVVATLFGRVSYTSDAVETALISWKTDTLFEFNPYTENSYELVPIERIKTPYAILYAVSARIIGKSPISVIRYIWPCIWIILSFVAVYLLATELLQGNKKAITVFLVLYVAVNIMGFSGEQSQPQMLLANAHDGLSVLINFVFPVLWYHSLMWMKNVEKNPIDKKRLYTTVGLWGCECAVAKSFCAYGFFLSILTIGIFVGIYMVRRWSRHVRHSGTD